MSRNCWTAEEDVVLDKHVSAGLNMGEIAKCMVRSYSSVYVRCLKRNAKSYEAEYNQRVTQARPRVCLRCGHGFQSSGPGNRICGTCVPLNAGYVGVVYD